MNEYLVEINDISKVFRIGSLISGSRLVALDKINLKVRSDRQSILSIVGESGSGKTTLAKIVLKILEPTSGMVKMNGVDIYGKDRLKNLDFLRTVQPIFQNPYSTFSARKPIHTYLYETALNLKLAANRKEATTKVSEALDSVGLDLKKVVGKYLLQFSGGEIQRISIARALIAQPKLIVADEPVSMIDASMKMNVVNLFKELKDRYQINFIYITHDLSTAYYVSDFIAIMYRGNIIEYGNSNDILETPYHPYTQMLMDAVPRVGRKWKKEIKLPEIETIEYGQKGCKFAARCPASREICSLHKPPQITFEDNRMVMCFKHTGYELN
jgi:peptide/nickel transport system ATP-binding protein